MAGKPSRHSLTLPQAPRLVLVYVCSFKLGIAPPPTGRIDMLVAPPKHLTGSYLLDSLLTGDMEALVSSAAHLVLPVITLAVVTGASIARMTYTSMRQVLTSQFILVGHAWGRECHRGALGGQALPCAQWCASVSMTSAKTLVPAARSAGAAYSASL